jgi:hypothetical protein
MVGFLPWKGGIEVRVEDTMEWFERPSKSPETDPGFG